MNYFKYNIFCFENFERLFGTYIRIKNSKHSTYNNENIEKKYLNKMRKTRFIKVKNSLLKLEKEFIELKNND